MKTLLRRPDGLRWAPASEPLSGFLGVFYGSLCHVFAHCASEKEAELVTGKRVGEAFFALRLNRARVPLALSVTPTRIQVRLSLDVMALNGLSVPALITRPASRAPL